MLPSRKFQDVPSFQLQGPKLERKTDTNFLPDSMPAGPWRRANHAVLFPTVMFDSSTEKKLDSLPIVNESSKKCEQEEEEQVDNKKVGFSLCLHSLFKKLRLEGFWTIRLLQF